MTNEPVFASFSYFPIGIASEFSYSVLCSACGACSQPGVGSSVSQQGKHSISICSRVADRECFIFSTASASEGKDVGSKIFPESEYSL
jgi:hypothetical protein